MSDNLKEITLFVMWKLEKFILKRKAGEQKRSLAVGILKKFFHEDENLTGLYIDSLMKERVQIKTIRRLALKAWRYLLKKN